MIFFHIFNDKTKYEIIFLGIFSFLIIFQKPYIGLQKIINIFKVMYAKLNYNETFGYPLVMEKMLFVAYRAGLMILGFYSILCIN